MGGVSGARSGIGQERYVNDLFATRFEAGTDPWARQCYDRRAMTRVERRATTREQRSERDADAGERCPLCLRRWRRGGRRYTPCWDHCHTCGYFRGALCSTCNGNLGQHERSLRDSPRVRAAERRPFEAGLSLAVRFRRAQWRYRARNYLNQHDRVCATLQELAGSRRRWAAQ